MTEQKLLVYKIEDNDDRKKINTDVNNFLNNGWSIKLLNPMSGDQHIYATVFVVLERELKNKIS